MPDRTEVVVTGIGVLSSIGNKRDDFWKALVSGESGVRRIQAFDPAGHESQIASEVSFDPSDHLPRRQARPASGNPGDPPTKWLPRHAAGSFHSSRGDVGSFITSENP